MATLQNIDYGFPRKMQTAPAARENNDYWSSHRAEDRTLDLSEMLSSPPDVTNSPNLLYREQIEFG